MEQFINFNPQDKVKPELLSALLKDDNLLRESIDIAVDYLMRTIVGRLEMVVEEVNKTEKTGKFRLNSDAIIERMRYKLEKSSWLPLLDNVLFFNSPIESLIEATELDDYITYVKNAKKRGRTKITELLDGIEDEKVWNIIKVIYFHVKHVANKLIDYLIAILSSFFEIKPPERITGKIAHYFRLLTDFNAKDLFFTEIPSLRNMQHKFKWFTTKVKHYIITKTEVADIKKRNLMQQLKDLITDKIHELSLL